MSESAIQTVNITSSPNFIFLLSSGDLKNLEFRVQSFSGLGMTLGDNIRAWNGLTITRPGDSITFNELTLSILLDEELNIIEDLYNYLFRIRNFEENTLNTDDWTGTLFVSTNRNNYTKKFIFNECWIKAFTDIPFTSAELSVNPLTTDITINFSHYTIEDTE